jgi:phospholipid transport system substrate-binding protein
MRATPRRRAWTGKFAGLCLALAFVTASAGAASAATPGPQDTIRSFYAVLLTTMKQGPTLGQSGRYAALAPAVRQDFDLPFMTKLAVGPDWSNLTQSQQQQLTTAFGRYVTATYAYRFDHYSGESFQVGSEQPFAGGYYIQSKILRRTGDPVTMNYLVREDDGNWEIADVYLDGTISQLATQRAEFNAILQSKGVNGLIEALNNKVSFLQRNPPDAT